MLAHRHRRAVALALAASYAISRALGLPKTRVHPDRLRQFDLRQFGHRGGRTGDRRRHDDIASSIAFTAILGVVVVLGLPLFIPLLAVATQYGMLAGLTVYAVPQVLAATLPISAVSAQLGTLVKLVRVLMLGPVVLGLSLAASRLRARRRRERAALAAVQGAGAVVHHRLSAARTLRSLGFIPLNIVEPLRTVASVLTTISMAALGLGVDVRRKSRAGRGCA